MDNLDLICEYYSNLDRQGPGSEEVTLKALSFIDGLHSCSQIADIGCGTGGQTLTLTAGTSGHITAVDLFEPFIDILKANVAKQGLQGRVDGVVASMTNLPFQAEQFDLLWSEGAIYNMGFKRGLVEFNRFIKPGGYVAVSELSWLTNERPDECTQHWVSEYPEISTVSKNLEHMLETGYSPVACFILPDECWIKHYYEPQAPVQEHFLSKHKSKEAEELVAGQQQEYDLYNRYSDFYGYAFYIGKKVKSLKE